MDNPKKKKCSETMRALNYNKNEKMEERKT